MLEYCFAFVGYIDALPLELFASWATLPLGLLCLLGCFASWATLPLGLSCLLGFIPTLFLSGYVSSTLSALTMPVY
jgi:hypothetical protein